MCDSLSTPDCLRALYKTPNGRTANPKNIYGILELSPETYSQPGLDVFFRNFTPGLVGRPPKFESIDGGAKLPPGPPPITSSVSDQQAPFQLATNVMPRRLMSVVG